MVEAKIRVELTTNRDKNLIGEKNPFYGNTKVKKVVEETFEHDFDKRTNIAPSGVIAKVKFPKKDGEQDVMTIKVNSYYFEYESENGYVAFFNIDEKVYELFVCFHGKQITNVTLSEWLSYGYFEDGDDADNIYSKEIEIEYYHS